MQKTWIYSNKMHLSTPVREPTKRKIKLNRGLIPGFRKMWMCILIHSSNGPIDAGWIKIMEDKVTILQQHEFARDRTQDKELWTQDRGPQNRGPRTEDPGERTQDRGARTEDPEQRSQDRGPRTEHLGQNDRESRSKDMIEDCRSRTLDESKPWMTNNLH